MQRLSDLDRRTYIKGALGTAALAGGVPVAAGGVPQQAARTDVDTTTHEGRERPNGRPILCDVSVPMGFETIMHYDGDPAFPGEEQVSLREHDEYPDPDKPREWVVHVTSEGMQTSDYAASLVNLRKRARQPVTLQDVRDGGIRYDYFQGPDHGGSAPDEVFLVLQTPQQADRNEGVALFKHVDDGQDAPASLGGGQWRTFDVSTHMTSGEWRAIQIHEDPEKMRVSEDETLGEAVERTAATLRDQEETFGNVFREYGGDAEVVGVGFGVGSTREQITVDVYYDNLVVRVPRPGEGRGRGQGDGDAGDGGRGDGGQGDGGQGDGGRGGGPSGNPPVRRDGQYWEYLFNFPAVLPMELSFDPSSAGSGQQTTARLDPTQEEMGIDFSRLVRDSVTLWAYTEAAPPLEEGVTAPGDQVDIVGGGYDVNFDAGAVAGLEKLTTGRESFVLVGGQLRFDQVVWFLGEGTLTVED